MFTLISTTPHHKATVKVWKRGATVATVTVFDNGCSMVSIQADGMHKQHIIGGFCDDNAMPTLLAHFSKG